MLTFMDCTGPNPVGIWLSVGRRMASMDTGLELGLEIKTIYSLMNHSKQITIWELYHLMPSLKAKMEEQVKPQILEYAGCHEHFVSTQTPYAALTEPQK